MNNNKYLLSAILVSAVFFSMCNNCKYTITYEYIESTCPIKFIHFQELVVDSLNNQGYPEKFIVKKEALLSANNSDIKFSKKLYFFKPNKNYLWLDYDTFSTSETSPILFQVNMWYKIRGLVSWGHPSRAAFIYMSLNNDFVVYRIDEQTNW